MTIYISKRNNSFSDTWYTGWKQGASGKGELDTERFITAIGGRIFDFHLYGDANEDPEFRSVRLDGMIAGIKQNDVIIFNYPVLYSHEMQQQLIDRIHFVGAYVVTYCQDVPAWQLYGDYENSEAEPFFDDVDGIITQTSNMAEQLRQQWSIPNAVPIVPRGLAGYATTMFDVKARHVDGPIDYAGAMHKAPFLNDLSEKIKLNVYANADSTFGISESISVKGSYDPEAIPHILDGSFGLVWDSETYPKISGTYGFYEHYNSPNKLSLYLAANEPVIVWTESADADFIVRNNIGFTIDNLDEIPAKIAQITEEQYQQMLKDTARIGNLVRSGYFLQRAVLERCREHY